MESIVGDWYVEFKENEHHFRVSYANTYDEPVGGLMNVLLTEDGQHYQHTDINERRALVIDIGGYITDWLALKIYSFDSFLMSRKTLSVAPAN
jgi:hypothetical protein